MVGMGSLTVVARDLVDVAADNGRWMTWNLILAAVPAALAVAVFRHRGPRTALWWTGAGLALFLPNAPYVVTDLVHLRDDVLGAGSDLSVITARAPHVRGVHRRGFLAYALAVGEMGRYLTRIGLAHWWHPPRWRPTPCARWGWCSGAWPRLNSWEPMTEPHGTAERIVLTLSWRGAPFAVLVTFALIWVCHGATRVGAARDRPPGSPPRRSAGWPDHSHSKFWPCRWVHNDQSRRTGARFRLSVVVRTVPGVILTPCCPSAAPCAVPRPCALRPLHRPCGRRRRARFRRRSTCAGRSSPTRVQA